VCVDNFMTSALVLGASMSGLLAARVLSDFYETVAVVERDALPVRPEMRRGVPQASHAHVLLARGGEVLAELFPGLLDELDEAGVPKWDDGDLSRRDIRIGTRSLSRHGRMRRPLRDYRPSRPLLDDVVRRRVRAIANVTILERHEVVALTSTGDRGRVTGAVVANRAAEETSPIAADLVIDATGRGSRTPVLLEQLGYGRPVEDELVIRLTYTSQWFQIPHGTMPVDVAGAFPEPDQSSGFALLENEEGRWGLSVGSTGHNEPAENCTALLSFIEDIAPPDVLDILRAAKPIGRVSKYRVPSNRWRRYDKMRRFPEGFVVVGDAFCSFNPVYGQGMTIAALEAITLRDCLRRGRSRLPRRYFRSAAKLVGTAWRTAVSSDLSLPSVTGPRPLTMRLANVYVERLLTAAESDPAVTEQFLRVAGMLDSPARLLHPAMILRVLRGQRRKITTPERPIAARPAELISKSRDGSR
jgi:2-polyprenyl-6-methoxyphenol hydroxylase-like FAD-dependent oxidoreductase